MNEIAEAFRTAIVEGLKSRTMTTCSRWAQHRRIMTGDFAGNYSFRKHPWCLEVHDSQAPFTSYMKAAQMGVTEAAINRAFYTLDVLQRDVLYVLPTAKGAGDFAKARFNTALALSPYLKSIFTDTNTIGLKQAGGVNLYIRGSRGSDDLVSIPVATLILDEVDRMDEAKIWLALERLSGHLEKEVLALSTPTVPKRGINKLYLQGSQEHYTFKCPHCGRRTELVWPDCVEIIGEGISDPRINETYLKCKECKHKLDHATKNEWLDLDNAVWVPTVECDDGHRSFYINQLYSFTVSPKELIMGYFRGMGDESAMVEFHNSKLGQPYVPPGGLITDEQMDAVVGTYSKEGLRPKWGGDRMICMGIDPGGLSHHVVIVEYFFDRYSSDLNVAATAKILWEGVVKGEYEEFDKLMREWQISGCVIDAEPHTNDARRFARRFPGYVNLCRYRAGRAGKEIQLAEEEGGAPVATVDRTNWLDASLGRFRSGRTKLPRDVSFEFREHMKNIVRTYERDELNNPCAVYLNTGADHFAHALNYAEIALPLAASFVTGADIKGFL